MFKWLGKILRRKTRAKPLEIINYGRYLHRPVLLRALSVVMNISQDEILSLIKGKGIYCNEEYLQQGFIATLRLHSGRYQIRVPSQNRLYKFYIA